MMAERQRTSDAILESSAHRKLVVAGPGTGKTHNFRRVLEAAGGGLALTFIRALAQDLEKDLGDLAQVNTFHGYCKRVAHQLGGTAGLTSKFDYFPQLPTIACEDLTILGHGDGLKADAFETPMRKLVFDDPVLLQSIAIGTYYDAVSHTDIVFRVQRHLAENQGDIPVHEVVVVDEYQDFNACETSLIELLAQTSPVLIAGDDDQALYEFLPLVLTWAKTH